MRVERVVVLLAVEQRGVAADHVVFVVAADAGKRRIDSDEAEVRIDHHHRLGHVAHDLSGDAPLALLLADGGHVTCGAGDAGDATVLAAGHRAAASPHPVPLPFVALDPVLGEEDRRLPAQVGAQAVEYQWQVLGVDPVVLFEVDLHRKVVAWVRFDAGGFKLLALHVVLPVELAGGPQRQACALLAFAQGGQVFALFAQAAQMQG